MAFLALMPCGDECSVNLCMAEGKNHIESRHNEDHTDNCSPLCTCICCNEIVSLAKSITLISYNNTVPFADTYSAEIPPINLKPGLRPPRS